MNQHENQLPTVDTGVETVVDQQAEQVETSPATEAEALQVRLDAIVEENNHLEVAVDDTARDAGVEFAVDHPEAVAADVQAMQDTLPKDDGPKTVAVAQEAKTMLEQVAVEVPDSAAAKGMVTKFCQDHFGGSLADVARACGDMIMPGSDVFRAVMKGEMPKGRDLARLASGMIAPPLGTVTFDLVFAKSGGTPQEIKQAAIKGRLTADLMRAVGMFLPEVAVVTTPAAIVMENVSKEVGKTADRGNTSAADRAKAFGRGLTQDPSKLVAIAEGLGVKMTSDAALEAAGITGDSAETVKAVGRLVAGNPDKMAGILGKIFVDDGGIVAEPAGMPDGAISMAA